MKLSELNKFMFVLGQFEKIKKLVLIDDADVHFDPPAVVFPAYYYNGDFLMFSEALATMINNARQFEGKQIVPPNEGIGVDSVDQAWVRMIGDLELNRLAAFRDRVKEVHKEEYGAYCDWQDEDDLVPLHQLITLCSLANESDAVLHLIYDVL